MKIIINPDNKYREMYSELKTKLTPDIISKINKKELDIEICSSKGPIRELLELDGRKTNTTIMYEFKNRNTVRMCLENLGIESESVDEIMGNIS